MRRTSKPRQPASKSLGDRESTTLYEETDRFRLLIVGDRGCGKATILSKVCGEEVADTPSSFRGVQDIEKEVAFKDNKFLLVHDSEGFEAGRKEELNIVKKFIESRCRREIFNERLHAIWYCLSTNPKEIQKAEMFFSVSCEAPVVAVFPNFDILVQDELQGVLKGADKEIADEKLLEQARTLAIEKFEKHYKTVLMQMPHPPKAVVAVSDVHESTPRDSRLAELIEATMASLKVDDKIAKDDPRRRLEALFVRAQMADVGSKRRLSLHYGLSYAVSQKDVEVPLSHFRRNLIEIWGTAWPVKTILPMFKGYIEDHPQTVGNVASLPHSEIKRMKPVEIKACRCAQLVADLILIMEQIFLLNIRDDLVLEEFVKEYPSSPAFEFVQRDVAAIDWSLRALRDEKDGTRIVMQRISGQLKKIVDRISSIEEDKFRLLIIGKSGCGKTTILSKVCGEEVADKPSEFRGVHNINKEMTFKDNKLFLVHDSEGFEAGRKEEFNVVQKFIKSRWRRGKVNERLHVIWYCLSTNPEDIRKAEMFFSVPHEVPVVAIFTKFDLLVQDELQHVTEGADEETEEVLEQARTLAMKKFEKNCKAVLMQMPHPPKAVVAVSDIHESTPRDSRLTELIEATIASLKVDDKIAKDDPRSRLEALFARAQMADVGSKRRLSLYCGLPYTVYEQDVQVLSLYFRRTLIEVWGTAWSAKTIMPVFKTYIEDHPQTIGNLGSLTRSDIKKMRPMEQNACRCAQLVADLILIMEQIFLLNIRDDLVLEEFVKEYPSSPAFEFVQREVVAINWSSRALRDEKDGTRMMMQRISGQLKKIVDRISSIEEDKFRLLIIGKSGCGKTTILSKVCGEEVADKPSEFRGVHNINKEMTFKDNKLFLVHDSEGFEAGRKEEFNVVQKFIESRRHREKFNERLHAIWYCVLMNSRPIQQAEQMFFSVPREVPVVAIFTKFDLVVEDELSNVMDHADEDAEEEALMDEAKALALEKFEKHYKTVLMQMPHPPKAIVAVSNIHESTPKDSRLAELIQATMASLKVDEKIAKDDPRSRLESLFARAQMAEVEPKLPLSLYYGLPYAIYERDVQVPPPYFRRTLIEVWGSNWPVKTILPVFKSYIEDHPQTIGNSGSLTRPDIKKMRPMERNACRCAQLVADLILVMEQIFIFDIADKPALEELLKKYICSAAFAFVQREVVRIDWHLLRDESDKTRMMTWRINSQLKNILDRCRLEFPIELSV